MVHIRIKKGLDIPIKGKPEGNIRSLIPAGGAFPLAAPPQIALDLTPFDDIKFRLLVKIGDVVKIGDPLVEDKDSPGRMFVAPAAGVINDIIRGQKRVLQSIIINVSKEQEQHLEHPPIDIERATRDELTEKLKIGGLFSLIRSRPFNLLADPSKSPRSIFVKAIESAPFVPPSELQVAGYEKEFQLGLNALTKLSNGPVHLVYSEDSTFRAFTEAKNVQKHTANGPHPVGNASVHIQYIDPIRSPEDIVWTLTAHDVVCIGYFCLTGKTFINRIISIAGPGVLSDRTGYFTAREGYPIESLIAGRIQKGELRFISGDPLMGKKVEATDFLGFNHYVFCVIPENLNREFLHFFRLGTDKYSFSKAYFTGHLNNQDREYEFTTNQHGEHRAFIDSTLYDQVQPLSISTMLLVKAVMAEDFDLADKLGLLEVDSEDFALPTFVCPSKMEMTEIMKTGLKQYAKESLS